MRLRRSGSEWLLIIGLIAWTGCSEDATNSDAGSDGSASEASVPAVAIPELPTAPSEEIEEVPLSEPQTMSVGELIEAGRSAYNASCTACHSLDPTKEGALGPAVAGSSLALLEARVLRAEYPEGYQAKRNTRVMIPLPHLESRLPELVAYLESLGE